MEVLRSVVKIHGDELNLKVGDSFMTHDESGRKEVWEVKQVNTTTIVFESYTDGLLGNPWSVAIQIPFVNPEGNPTFVGLQALRSLNAPDFDQDPSDGEPPLEDEIEAMFDDYRRN